MVRRQAQPEATTTKILECTYRACISCGGRMWHDYDNYRRVRTLKVVVQLHLKIRRCPDPQCQRFRLPYRPEAEGQWALPQHEFGLDVIALVGALRHQQHRSVSEIHRHLQQCQVQVSERTVSNLLVRYDELLAVKLGDSEHIATIVREHQRAILALDGLQPDVGHEVLWVVRDCLSGEIMLAKTLLSATTSDLAALLVQVKQALPVPIVAVVSDGQQSIRQAVAAALPEAAHGLCQFHYLREAAKQIYDADRHAKKELKKQVRGVRAIERSVADSPGEMGEVVQGYCQAVRAALTDDGRPPLDAAGLRLHERLDAIEQSLGRIEQTQNLPSRSRN